MEDDDFSDYEPSRPWEEIGMIVRIQHRATKSSSDPRPVFRAIPNSQGETF